MTNINENFAKLPGSYLFLEIARRTKAHEEANPSADIIRLGIGDVTRPIIPAVCEAMSKAALDMGKIDSFMGYGPYEGYDFLRQAIVENDFKPHGVNLDIDEIFVSDGAKSDCGNIGELFAVDNKVAVCDPVYPVYVDSNALEGRAGTYDASKEMWSNIHYMPTIPANGFCPQIPDEKVDLIYICSPNNPTGTALNRDQLKGWVEYARSNDSIIMFDAAYESFIVEDDIPHSIFEIDGAKECAIEFRSFSKTAGFTGLRLGYTVIPKDLKRGGSSLNEMWLRRQSTKFNGASCVVQKGAMAIYTPEGKKQIATNIDYYRNNAKVIKSGLESVGLKVYGAVNSPYAWVETPDGKPSWDFFDQLLKEANVVTTPGAGFGPAGEGYIRLTAFGDKDATYDAVERIKGVLG